MDHLLYTHQRYHRTLSLTPRKLICDIGLTDNVSGETTRVVVGRKKKKITLTLEGDLPLLPPPPKDGLENSETLQSMIREFITIHYHLACGKTTATPWTSLTANQSILWDSNMWPEGVMVRDPSKIVLKDCQKIVQLWRARQTEVGAKKTFRFNFYLASDGVHRAMYDTTHTPPVSLAVSPGLPPLMVQQSPSNSNPPDSLATPRAAVGHPPAA